MKYNTLLAAAIITATVAFSSGAEPESAKMTRADFAKAMATIKPGMTTAQVEDAIGKADDYVTSDDPGADYTRNAETWAYGTDGHQAFPTLGCVKLLNGYVQSVHGGGGAPPDPKMFDEAALRKLLRLIDKCESNNPLDLIQIVNTLQPLGKEKALAAISEYLRLDSHYGYGYSGEDIGVFLVLRLLFDVPDDPGYLPRMMVGAPDPEEPKDPKILPRFPLAVIDDIPLNLVFGYSLGGEAEPAQDHVEYFRKNGKLREHPLRPGNDPLSLLAKIRSSPQWIYKDRESDRGSRQLANQLLALVDSVYHTEADYLGQRIPAGKFDEQNWERITKEFARLHVKWNARQNLYTFGDGTTLPEMKKPVYGRIVWDLPSLKPDGRLIMERVDANHVQVVLWHQGSHGRPAVKTTIRVFKPWDEHHPLAQFDIPFEPGATSTVIELETDGSIQAEAVSSKKTDYSMMGSL